MQNTVLAENAKRLRVDRGLTQAEVAEKARVSPATYSKIELGRATPRVDTLYKIATALAVDIQELLVPVRELKAVRFRAQKKLKRRTQVLARTATWLDDFNYLLDETGMNPEYTLSQIPKKARRAARNQRPLQAARLVRSHMGLDEDEPIHDLAGLLAKHGVKVLAHRVASDGFFGMSIGVSDGGPAIVVNTWDRIPVERWIFSTAHELGHLLLHLDAYDVSEVEEDSDQEHEANLFASLFLMPQRGFEKEWNETSGLSTWDRILKVKRIYHVSYKTVLFRLKEMGVYDESIWRRINVFLRSYYAKRTITKSFEPERLQSCDFVTDWLERVTRIAVERDIISLNRAGEILGVSLQEIRERAATWAGVELAAES